MALLDVRTMTHNQLLSIYNRIAHHQARRFSDRSAAAVRVATMLSMRGLKVSSTAVVPGAMQVSDQMFLIPENAPVRSNRVKFNNRVYDVDEVIVAITPTYYCEKTGMLKHTNPKRAGSKAAARFDIILELGRVTVGDYIWRACMIDGDIKEPKHYGRDIAWDVDHGYVKIEGSKNW